MAPESSFQELMAQLRQGDEAAARRIFQEYTERLIALARSRLGRRLRQKVDPEDVLQSVYKSFFTRHARGQLEVEGWDGLWGMLTLITLRKCGRWVERFTSQKRNVAVEVSPAEGRSGDGWEAVAQGPTPVEAAILAETVEHLIATLQGRERDIVALALQGCTVAEISTQVGRTRRTVQRVLRRVREHLQLLGDEGQAREQGGGK
jgi:RNA polymerase sigma-70 factor (ECF subfamily)